MSLTPYHLLPADQSDISTLASIFTLAFSTDHILGPINKLVSPEALREADMQFVQKLWITREKLNARFYKVMDTESGKIIGFSKWNYPRSLTHEERYKEVGVKKKGPYPAGTNISLLEHYYDQMWAKREKWINPEKTFFLHILATLPSHRRRGIGALLLSPGLSAANNANASIYLEASPDGLGIYLRNGWKWVDEMRVRLSGEEDGVDMEQGNENGNEEEDVVVIGCYVKEPQGI